MKAHYITELSQKNGDFSDDGEVPDSEQKTKIAVSPPPPTSVCGPAAAGYHPSKPESPYLKIKQKLGNVFGKHKQGHNLDE